MGQAGLKFDLRMILSYQMLRQIDDRFNRLTANCFKSLTRPYRRPSSIRGYENRSGPLLGMSIGFVFP